jgi:hypothetical protein
VLHAHHRPRPGEDFPATFLPRRIGRAADREMEAVLEEDALLREFEQALREQQAAR